MEAAVEAVFEKAAEPINYLLAENAVATIHELAVTVQFKNDFESTKIYRDFCEERLGLKDISEVRSFRKRLNAYSKQYHAELVASNLDSLSDLDYTSCEAVGYAPYALLEMPTQNLELSVLEDIAEEECIVDISLAPQVDADAVMAEEEPSSEAETASTINLSWDDMLRELNAYDIVENGTYTGNDIYIGIMEAGGICNKEHQNLDGKLITFENPDAEISGHATRVTSIVASIAPEATYFVQDASECTLAWFLDQCCDIVNCSLGYYFNEELEDGTYANGVKGYRNAYDGIFDYQISTCHITVVKSAGNYSNDNESDKYNPEGSVTTPGYAFNVITVGGVKYTDSGWEHALGSGYWCFYPTVKPNVTAPYRVAIPNYSEARSGTSLSAPIVTGFVALLMESDSSYCLAPEMTLSVVTSAAVKTHNYAQIADGDEVTAIGNFDTRVGSGVIDLERMIENTSYFCLSNRNKQSQSVRARQDVYLTANQEIQIGLAWCVYIGLNNYADKAEAIYNTEYHLRLYDPNGTLVASSTLEDCNVQLIRYTAPTSGNYQITVFQSGSQANEVACDYLAVTYNCE